MQPAILCGGPFHGRRVDVDFGAWEYYAPMPVAPVVTLRPAFPYPARMQAAVYGRTGDVITSDDTGPRVVFDYRGTR